MGLGGDLYMWKPQIDYFARSPHEFQTLVYGPFQVSLSLSLSLMKNDNTKNVFQIIEASDSQIMYKVVILHVGWRKMQLM